MPNLIPIQENDGVETTRQVYGIDYLGQQGRSWPVDCDDGNSENERKLSNLLRQLLFLIMVKIRKSI
jgi:hypothetical protein